MIKKILVILCATFTLCASWHTEKNEFHNRHAINVSAESMATLEKFTAKSNGWLEFTKEKKPSFLNLSPSHSCKDVQLVGAECTESCCKSQIFKSIREPLEKRLDKNFCSWGRVLSYGVNVRANFSIYEKPYEVWERYVSPGSNYYYGYEFLGYVSVKKVPSNFYEFYKSYKYGQYDLKNYDGIEERFEKITAEAVERNDPVLSFKAIVNGEKNTYMFDKYLGSGCQGFVARAIDPQNPNNKPIVVKMFSSREDHTFGKVIDLIENEIKERSEICAKLLHNEAQNICDFESLVMEYVDGETANDFFKKHDLESFSENQIDILLQELWFLVDTKDLNGSNLMVELNNKDSLYHFKQIDVALADWYAYSHYKEDLGKYLEESKEKVVTKNLNEAGFKIYNFLKEAGFITEGSTSI